MSDAQLSPWPGPRPFSNEEQQLLFGRDADMEQFAVLLQTKQVVQLSAKSGMGKTSFLRAKVVPAMDEAGIITLVYRTWAGVGGTNRSGSDAGELYASALAAGARDYTLRTGRSLPELSGVDLAADLDQLVNVEDSLGVAIIFDQFEELLRRDARLGRRFLSEVSRVARDVGVKQVISLRSEYAIDLLVLHRELGGIIQSAQLEELDEDALRDVIQAPPRMKPFGVVVTDDAADLLLAWWDEARAAQAKTRLTNAEVVDIGHLGASDVGLLHLQALLWATYRHWRLTASADTHTIDRTDIESFASSLGADGGVQTITESLRRWIEEPLSTESLDFDTIRLLGTAGDIAAAFAPSLSAAGYKSAQELMNLARLTIGPDLLRLGFGHIELDKVLDVLREELVEASGSSDDVLVARLRAAGAKLDDLLAGGSTSSSGRIAGYVYREFAAVRREAIEESRAVTPEEHASALRLAARELLCGFMLAVHRLQSRYVLTEPPAQSGARLIELVHDGFGPALIAWGVERLDGPRVAIESNVAISGRDLVWRSVTTADLPFGSANGLCWVGCWISGQRGSRLQIQDVEFRDCDFTGSAFERVDFRGVTFNDCLLRGTLFKDCLFDDVSFSEADISMTTFVGARSTETRLSDVDGACVIFDGLGDGLWDFERTAIRLCLFRPPPNAASPAIVRIRRSVLSHWQIDDGAVGQMEIEGSSVQFATSDESDRSHWLTMSGCEQAGSNFPTPALASSSVTECPPMALEDSRPELILYPVGDAVDPWKAGRR